MSNKLTNGTLDAAIRAMKKQRWMGDDVKAAGFVGSVVRNNWDKLAEKYHLDKRNMTDEQKVTLVLTDTFRYIKFMSSFAPKGPHNFPMTTMNGRIDYEMRWIDERFCPTEKGQEIIDGYLNAKQGTKQPEVNSQYQ